MHLYHRSIIVILILFVVFPIFARTVTIEAGHEKYIDEEVSDTIDRAVVLLEQTQVDSAMILASGLLERVNDGDSVSNLQAIRLHLLIGSIYYLQRQLDSSEIYVRKAMDLAEGNASADSLVADAFCALGYIYDIRNQLTESINCFRRVMEIHIGMFGPENSVVAEDRLRLGKYLVALHRYDETESMLLESLRVYETLKGPADTNVARVLSNLAILYAELYEYNRALEYAFRALDIAEKVHGPSHPSVAISLGQVATIYRGIGQYNKAEPLYLRAMDIWNGQKTPQYLSVAMCFRNLGSLYESQGRYGEAEECYLKALKIRVNKLGAKHSHVAATLNCLGNVCCKQGRWDDAEKYYNQVMAIWNDRGESRSLGAAKCLVNMAVQYQARGDWNLAEQCARSALDIREEVLPPNHPDIADALNQLGNILIGKHFYTEAELLIRKMVSIHRESLGPNHPTVASGLITMARLCRSQGRNVEAEDCLKQALAIREEVLGPKHPNVFEAQRELACLYAETGRIEQSLALHRQSQRSRYEFVSDVFCSSSESQKLRWIRKMPLIDDKFLSLVLTVDDREVAQAAMEMVLRGKSAVNEAVMAENRAAFCSEDADVVQTLDERASVCTEISNAALSDEDGGSPDPHRERMLSLYQIKDSLDEQLSRTCRIFEEMVTNRKASPADVAASLPPGAVLWEYVRLDSGRTEFSARADDGNDPARYLGMVLTDRGEVHVVDLGDAEPIDSLIQEYVSHVNEAISRINSSALAYMESLLSSISEELYRKIFAPLAERCQGRDEIFICPDGSLNLLPFEALSMEGGKYVIEDYRLSYLSSGRDLVRFGTEKHEEIHRALVMADPDFDAPLDPISAKPNGGPAAAGFIEPARGTTDCLEEGFPRLRFTRMESEAVAQTIHNKVGIMVEEKYGQDATESVLKKLAEVPEILHIATHGFACGGPAGVAALDNPLLRSGLVLAGANCRPGGIYSSPRLAEDGLLTAFEVSGLNLLGTELVCLSACKTGVGEVVSSEGVFGLRRAFQHAGARSILMSLWKVPDQQTSLLMEGFYTRWLGGMNKRDALRGAALGIISSSRTERGCAHPVLWGGFILVGDPE